MFEEINVIKVKKFINIYARNTEQHEDDADYLLNLCLLQRLKIKIKMFCWVKLFMASSYTRCTMYTDTASSCHEIETRRMRSQRTVMTILPT